MHVSNSFVYLGNTLGEVQIRQISTLNTIKCVVKYPEEKEIKTLLSHNNRLVIGTKGGKFISIWNTNDLQLGKSESIKECGRIIC